ncbi:MAG: isocitrate/isopropylmalate family dehydrogenase, partial [Pseudomonadota bacterium]
MSKNILLLAGDGIGSEVVAQTVRILDWFNQNFATDFVTSEGDIGGVAYDKTGSPLPQATLDAAHKADAILL